MTFTALRGWPKEAPAQRKVTHCRHRLGDLNIMQMPMEVGLAAPIAEFRRRARFPMQTKLGTALDVGVGSAVDAGQQK